MSELKRTQLYNAHLAAEATMVDFGGWEMPIQYPSGIVAEHLYTRHFCGLFDVSHMGRLLIEGPERVQFLQHVLSSNVQALDVNEAQYCIIPNENGGAIDDAYLYRFEEDRFLLVVNAANTEKDLVHLREQIKAFNCTLTDISDKTASIAVQGPKSREMLEKLAEGVQLTELVKNALGTVTMEGRTVRLAKTGYTGEPLGYEVFVKSEDAEWLWNRLLELGGRPAGLGARDTLRMEAMMPLYGHEFGVDIEGKEIPIFAVPLAKFAVSFSELKGNFIGREKLARQFEAFKKIQDRNFEDIAVLPRRMMPITLLERGVIRKDMPVYRNDKLVGYITSGTMVPYYVADGEGMATTYTQETAKRSIGIAMLDSDIQTDDIVYVDLRGKKVKAVVPRMHMSTMAPPYARPILYTPPFQGKPADGTGYRAEALELIRKSIENHLWRQKKCINLIPSENTPSRAVQMLCASDPAFRYAEHKKIASFYDNEIFYYQGTKFIEHVEELLVEQMRQYLGATEVETRVISGQMSNTAVFSSLMDFKNRNNRKVNPQRLGYILHNHIAKGGHLSAQPMGALHDYVAVDPVTERNAVVPFPVLPENHYKIDVEETKKVIDRYRPEFIVFGKSMVLHKEPVKEIREFVDQMGLQTTIMYDMAHVLGLVGDHFQKPFEEGAEIVTGSTHKTFFGPQRGIVGVNYKPEDLKWNLWKTIESRAFPGSVSNHHLGTQLGLLMAAYEMNTFKDEYQRNVIENAKHFAKCLKAEGLDVAGDPAISFTETHQVIVNVGYAMGYDVAERLESNGIIVNYQATPEEESFTASGALRMGVEEMTRFGFTKDDFAKLAAIMADCILREKDVTEEVQKLRAEHTVMQYCFSDEEFNETLGNLMGVLGV